MVWHAANPTRTVYVDVTLTPSKVKVTELPKLQKLHFSTTISSTVLAWSSKRMIVADSIGPGLQLVGVQFLNFLLGKLSQQYKLCQMSIFHEIQTAIFRR